MIAAIDALNQTTRKLHDQVVAHALMFQLDLRPHDMDDASSSSVGGASSSGSVERERAVQVQAKIARCLGVPQNMCMALQVTLDPACLRTGYLVPVILAVRLPVHTFVHFVVSHSLRVWCLGYMILQHAQCRCEVLQGSTRRVACMAGMTVAWICRDNRRQY